MTRAGASPSRAELGAAAAAIFLFCMAVNVRRLCPDVFADDSPETVATCASLGVSHPPGDPVLMLIGRLALAVPAGGAGFRMNLLAAALAAGLAAAMWLQVVRGFPLPLARLAAAAAALGLATSNPVLAQQAAVAKGAVYGLNLLLLLAIFAAARSSRRLLGGLAGGLLLAHHWMTFAAFAPVLAGWGLLHRVGDRRGAGRRIALTLVAGALGAGAWVAIPIRAAAGPAMNSGHAATIHRAAAHLMRKPFVATELAPAPASVWAQSVAGVGAVLAELGLPGVLLAVAGAAWLLPLEPAGLWVPAGAGLAGLAATALYLHLPRELFRLLPIFLLPCWLFAFRVALVGAAALGESTRRWQRALAVLLCLAGPLLQAPALGRSEVSRCTWSPDLGRALLAPLPKRAGLVLVSDLDTFAVWEQQIVRRFRPDVEVVNFMLLRHAWYRRDLIERGAPAALSAAATREAALGIVLRDRRRIWFSSAVPLEGTPRSYRRMPYHLTFRLTSGSAKPAFPRGYSYRGLFERDGHRPEPSAMLTVGYTMECLRNLLREGMPPR